MRPRLVPSAAGARLLRHVARALLGIGFALASTGLAAGRAAPAKPRACLSELGSGRGAEVVCEHPAWLAEQERADLRRLTRDLLQDARCRISVRIERRLVDEALTRSDHVFTAPPQPVSCEIVTKDSVIPITGTFAPRIVFKDGRAVEGSPNLADVKGVNSYLAWPVVQYVNRSAAVRDEMLRMINLYKERITLTGIAHPHR